MKILIVVGSPRKGNSETIALRFNEEFKNLGIESEVLLLREKNIERCEGCVEFCNHKLYCKKKDDMPEIFTKLENSDGYVFITPNYFQMPPGIFKDFIDRCSIFFTAGREQEVFGGKKAVVVCVGTDKPEGTDVCTNIISKNFCEIIQLDVLGKKSYQTNSELKGNFNDIFENGKNPTIQQDIKEMASSFLK